MYDKMIVVDGSFGEGGGQIVRTAVALSLIMRKEVLIYNIRKNRHPKGLKNQHLRILKFISEYFDVEIEGVKIGSEEIYINGKNFSSPEKIDVEYDLKTAASITLFLQGILPIAFYYNIPLFLTIKGGTNVKQSPSIDYYEKVFFPLLNDIGFKIELKVIRKGYYPKGKGKVMVHFKGFEPIFLKEGWWYYEGREYVHEMNISKNIKKMHYRDLCDIAYNYLFNLIKLKQHECKYTPYEGLDGIIYNDYVGIDYLGEKGKRLEDILHEKIKYIKGCEEENTRIDAYLGDQLLLPLSIYSNRIRRAVEYKISYITTHLITNMYVISNIFKFSHIRLDEKEKILRIKP